MATKKSNSVKSVEDWMAMMEEWFSKLPSIPVNGKQTIVGITPWIALIFGVLGVAGGLAGLGLLTAFSPFMALSNGFGGAAGSLISSALSLAAAVLLLVAFPGTKAHKMQGWKMLFYSEAVSVLASIVIFSVSGVLFSLIGFYLLFQIKSYYK